MSDSAFKFCLLAVLIVLLVCMLAHVIYEDVFRNRVRWREMDTAAARWAAPWWALTWLLTFGRQGRLPWEWVEDQEALAEEMLHDRVRALVTGNTGTR